MDLLIFVLGLFGTLPWVADTLDYYLRKAFT